MVYASYFQEMSSNIENKIKSYVSSKTQKNFVINISMQ